MTPRGTSNAFRTGASHFISLRSPFATPGGWLVTKLQRALWISANFRLMSLRKKCFQATEIILALTLACSGLHAQASRVQTFPLSGAQDLDARNVKVESTEYKGRKAIRITLPDSPAPGLRFTLLRGVDFADGTIEADVAAKVTLITPAGLPNPPGFIGIAFRSRSDAKHYELFYIRPGNSGSSDQLQRNHSVQYVSMPDFDWYKLRRSWPSVYEAYADLEPEAWTRMKIEVAGRQAKLYLNSAPRPVLVVDRIKGEDLTGGIGLWASGGQESYFSNVRITHAKPQAVENGGDATGTWDIKYGIGRFSGSLKLNRVGGTVSGTASGLRGTDVPIEVNGGIRRGHGRAGYRNLAEWVFGNRLSRRIAGQ
jgi:hypothetical protein